MEKERAKITIPHLLSIAYFIAGVALIVAAAQSRYIPIHVGIIGVLNIIASCGIYLKRKWTFYTLIFISLISLAFGSITLTTMIYIFSYDPISILMFIGMTFYIALSITLLVYTITQKNKFI
ncbi:MAG: hypothetical protein QXX99_00825 [Candidatus Bathyarchaeia archaeon]